MQYLLDGEESDRLLFRKIQYSDYEVWLKFFEDSETSKHWIFDNDEPKIECIKWYKKQFDRYENNEGGMNALIDKITNKLVGHCGLLKQTVDSFSEIEIAYSLLPEFWNQGYATEAAKKCRMFAFENNLSKSLISIISLTNLPSERVAIKIGMTLDKATFYNKNKVNVFRVSHDNLQV